MSSTGLATNKELRAAAREQLKGNWGNPILVTLIYILIFGGGGFIPIIGSIITLVITGALSYGNANFFLKFSRNENAIVEDLFSGFKIFGKAFSLQFLVIFFTFLWSLLLIIPGIIAGFSYSMSFYILRDNPNMTAREALRCSKQMMRGHKGQLFVLGWSFIGWALLCTLTLGIGMFWLVPYMNLSYTKFYEGLKESEQVLEKLKISNNPIEPNL